MLNDFFPPRVPDNWRICIFDILLFSYLSEDPVGDAWAPEDVSGRWSVSDTQKVNYFLRIGPRVHLDVQMEGIC